MKLDRQRLQQTLLTRTSQWTRAAQDIAQYLGAQVSDDTHREVIGPLLPASGGSGVVLYRGDEVGRWGDPTVPEMAFSVTKDRRLGRGRGGL